MSPFGWKVQKLQKDDLTYLIWMEKPGRTVEILDIHVHPNKRRQGIGKSMIEELQRMLTPPYTLFAWCRGSNYGAHQFYLACGFTLAGFCPVLYSDEESEAMLFCKVVRE